MISIFLVKITFYLEGTNVNNNGWETLKIRFLWGGSFNTYCAYVRVSSSLIDKRCLEIFMYSNGNEYCMDWNIIIIYENVLRFKGRFEADLKADLRPI